MAKRAKISQKKRAPAWKKYTIAGGGGGDLYDLRPGIEWLQPVLQGGFSTDFQCQYEKQVAANQDYFFKKFSL